MTQRYKIAVYVPKAQAEKVKQAAFAHGAGRIGFYQDVSFAIPGKSEFTPGPNATPAIGKSGEVESVDEVKLEMSVTGESVARAVVGAIRDAHPYEEVVVDVYKLEDF